MKKGAEYYSLNWVRMSLNRGFSGVHTVLSSTTMWVATGPAVVVNTLLAFCCCCWVLLTCTPIFGVVPLRWRTSILRRFGSPLLVDKSVFETGWLGKVTGTLIWETKSWIWVPEMNYQFQLFFFLILIFILF